MRNTIRVSIDRASISLVPRTTSNCLDMAIMFFGRHVASVLRLWLIFSVPSCLLVYVLAGQFEFDLRTVLAVIFFVTSPFGVLLISASAAASFGGPFALKGKLDRTLVRVSFVGLLMRAALGFGPGLCLFASGWILVTGALVCLVELVFLLFGVRFLIRMGFLTEQTCLAPLDEKLHDRQVEQIVREEAYDLVVRWVLIVAFSFVLWLVVFLTVDLISGTVLGLPILVGRVVADEGRMASPEVFFDYFFDLVFFDPLVLSSITATSLVVYPIGRLAWFFCLIDVRVRRDCWDMELRFRQEAKRLEDAR